MLFVLEHRRDWQTIYRGPPQERWRCVDDLCKMVEWGCPPEELSIVQVASIYVPLQKKVDLASFC